MELPVSPWLHIEIAWREVGKPVFSLVVLWYLVLGKAYSLGLQCSSGLVRWLRGEGH